VPGAVSGVCEQGPPHSLTPRGIRGPSPEEGTDQDLEDLFAEGRPTLRSIAGYIQSVLQVCPSTLSFP